MKPNTYKIDKNNYVATFFLSIFLISLAIVLNHDLKDFKNKETEPSIKMIKEIETKEILEPTEEINNLLLYINPLEDEYTSYNSMLDNKVTLNDLNNNDMLYVAYKYLEKTNNFEDYYEETTYDTFKDYYNKTNINTNQKYYINTLITKKNLKAAIKKIFGVTITDFTTFNSPKACFIKDNDYICEKDTYSKSNSKIEFIKAIEYEDYMDIIIKYQYIEDNINYKDFTKKEVGEEYYKVTYEKIEENYYFDKAIKTTI